MKENHKLALKKRIKYRKDMIGDIESGCMNKNSIWSDYKSEKLELYKKELKELEIELKSLSVRPSLQ